MGDHHERPACKPAADTSYDSPLAVYVQGGGRFSQDQDLRFVQQSPGDAEPLALAAGKLGSTLTYERREPFGQCGGKLRDLGICTDGPHSRRRDVEQLQAIAIWQGLIDDDLYDRGWK